MKFHLFDKFPLPPVLPKPKISRHLWKANRDENTLFTCFNCSSHQFYEELQQYDDFDNSNWIMYCSDCGQLIDDYWDYE